MEIRLVRVPAFVGIVFLRDSFLLVLRLTARLARPTPALKFLATLAAVGLLVNIPRPASALTALAPSVGATPGSFAVSPSGAATYTIPIVVPPGTNGLQPNLALVYNSQTGNGLLGMGWSLAGLSVIHRCGATIEIDEFKGGVNYDSNDRFCLDGERLMLVGANEYRTHRESLQRVFFTGTVSAPTSFTVRDKDGLVREYGATDDSRIEARSKLKTTVRIWALSRISDRNSNTITFSYEKDIWNGDYRPASITYGANTSSGTIDHSSVIFTYADRPDVTPLYEGGSVIKVQKLLSKISTFAGGGIVREYRLEYTTAGTPVRSQLVRVRECGTDLACFPPTTFAWSDKVDVSTSGTWTGAHFGTNICANGSLSFGVCNDSDNHPTIQHPDVNGDGKADLVYRGDQGIQVWLSTGTGFVHGWSTNICANGSTAFGFCDNGDNYPTIQYPDVNGDGKADLVYRGDQGIQVWLSTGTSFISGWSTSICANGSTAFGFCDNGDNYPTIQYPDVNGDGKADLVYRSDQGIQVWLSTGTSFISGWSTSICANRSTAFGVCNDSDNHPTIQYADINGDGRASLAFRADGGIQIFNSGGLPDLLLTTTSGLGSLTRIDYQPLTNNAIYAKETSSAYPYQDVQDATYVVSSVSASDGVGGTNITTYRYGGLKKHHRADIYLGFRWIRITDPAGLLHLTYHDQDREGGRDGTVVVTETFASKVRIKHVANTWESTGIACGGTAGTSQPQLRAVYEETRELNNTVITQINTTNDYDACGFPASTVVNFNDGWRKSVTNAYSHDTANWILGLITRADVSAEAVGFLPQTRSSTFAYDAKGRLVSEVIEPERPELTLTTSYQYDGFGNRISKSVSGAGVAPRTDSQAFDAQGRFPISKTNALGHTTTFAYDPRNGQPTRMVDPNGLVTTWDYDGLGRKGLEVRPDGTRSTITYSAITGGYAILVESAGAAPIETRFDILGREIQRGTIGFGGRWIYRRIQYDALGRVIFKSHPEFNAPSPHGVTYGYDVLGRVTSATTAGPGNRTTTTDYNGLTTTVTNPLDQVTTTVKNSQGQAVQVSDAVGGTLYQYDPFGNLTQVTDAAGNVTRMEYDPRGRKTAMHEPNMGRWTYGYNALNELVSQADAKGQTVTITYDPLGRLETRTAPEGTSTWTYDTATKGIGKLAFLAGPGGYQEQYVYDTVSRPAQVITTVGATQYIVGQGYDSFGRLETITYPSTGYQVKQVYDAFGHLHQVNRVLVDGTETLIWMADDANAWNRITREFFGNAAISQRFYDPATTDLTAIKTGTGGANTQDLQNLTYTFDAIGNLLTRGDAITGLNEAFSYDSVNRLTQATGAVTKTYQYNAIGNVTFKSDVGTYSYPVSGANSVRPHAVTAVTGAVNATYTYDANGNMLSGGGRSITYTSFNKPASISANGQTTSLSYDPNYNRIQKVSGNKTTVYIGKLYEHITTGTLVEHKHYIYGSGNLVAIHTSRNNNTADTKYIHTDHLGSVNVITNDSGQVVERLSFDPHGKRRQTDGQDAAGTISSSTNRGFTKHEHDDEVGLINMNARLYDPVLGRFISPDTIVDRPAGQGLNRYSYVRNNPLSLTDPTGQSSLGKAFKRLKKKVARITTRVLEKVGGINYVGGLLRTGLLAGNNSFGAAYGWSTGDWRSVGQAHVQGAFIAGTAWLGGEFGALGRMTGSGINGWAQTGNSEGFLRGFISGAIPHDLGFSDAYRNSALANLGIGIVRDGLRGYVVGGRDGIREGIKYGQFTNLFGHVWGFVSSGFSASGFSGPEFRDGAFFYRGSTNPFYGAITLGNVVTDATPNGALYHNELHTDYEKWLNGHELAHVISQAPALGAAYIPAHIMSQWIGGGVGLPLLEYAPFHPLPYDSAPPVMYSF